MCSSIIYSPLCDSDPSLYAQYLRLVSDCIRRLDNVASDSGGLVASCSCAAGCVRGESATSAGAAASAGGRFCVGAQQFGLVGHVSRESVCAGFGSLPRDSSDGPAVGLGGGAPGLDVVGGSPDSRDSDDHEQAELRNPVGDGGSVGLCNFSGSECGLSPGSGQSDTDGRGCDAGPRTGVSGVGDQGLDHGQHTSPEKSGCVPNVYGHVRGPNWAYNNAGRIRRKAQRAKRAMLSDNWRKSESQGFFSKCDEDVQKDLRDSRAKLYIAQNKIKAEKAERELRDMNSVQGIIQQMTDVSTAVSKLKKQTTDDSVHGWAETVATSLTKSITESSSNVPSLESIKVGESSLKSSDGRVLDPVRVSAYERDIKYVEDVYADMDGYSVEVYERDIKRVKDGYEDILLTPEERAVNQFKKEVAARMFSNGLSYDKVSDCLLLE